MKFENKYATIYCKDYSYHKEYDNTGWHETNYIQYYKGYVVHREDGPAMIWYFEDNEWFLNGHQYSEEEYLNIINLKKKSKVLDDI